MGEGMSKAARDELLEAVRARYRDANRSEKSRILDEFAAISGYHRKHAIRVLLRDVTPEMRKGTQARIYDEAVRDALVVLWEASDRICGKRLKAALPGLLSRMETHGHLALDRSVREKLMRMSAATIDRCLVPARQGIKGKRRRAKNSAIKRQIPVRTSADWKDAAPGYLEADFVVHSFTLGLHEGFACALLRVDRRMLGMDGGCSADRPGADARGRSTARSSTAAPGAAPRDHSPSVGTGNFCKMMSAMLAGTLSRLSRRSSWSSEVANPTSR